MEKRFRVGVLGATGSVGQRFVSLLDGHPWFEVVGLTGSERKTGQRYGQGCQWILPSPMPAWAAGMPIKKSDPRELDADVVFSALPSAKAREIEPVFASAGAAVFSNASAYRAEADVPLLMPEVNPDHTGLIPLQKESRKWDGFIVTNPNCTSAGVTVVLKAFQEAYGVERVFLVSLQALSGAGYPGVASLDVMDNVIPFIDGEEEKVESEPLKMLGRFNGQEVVYNNFPISAQCNRVAVSDGHLACLSLGLQSAPKRLADVAVILRDYLPPAEAQNLPSTPNPVILLKEEANRPQPRLDRLTGGGMTTVVGRLRTDPTGGLKFVVLSHNTIRGAAGGSIYNAELVVSQGYL